MKLRFSRLPTCRKVQIAAAVILTMFLGACGSGGNGASDSGSAQTGEGNLTAVSAGNVPSATKDLGSSSSKTSDNSAASNIAAATDVGRHDRPLAEHRSLQLRRPRWLCPPAACSRQIVFNVTARTVYQPAASTGSRAKVHVRSPAR